MAPRDRNRRARDRPAPRSATPTVAWHTLTSRDAATRLETTGQGLSATEAELRLLRHGPNLLPEARRRGLFAIVLGQLRSPLIYLLLVAAAVSALIGDVSDAIFIALVLVINTAIGAAQEANAEANTAALRRAVHTSTRTNRDGSIVSLDSRELVPGDLVLLEAGDRVPADLRLVDAAAVAVDESSLTGESLPVEKAAGSALPVEAPLAERDNMLFAGSLVQRGHASGLVVATAGATELGRIAEALRAPPASAPLTKRLGSFTRLLGIVSLGLVVLIIGPRLLSGADVRETLLIGVALAIAIIPEGLPVAVTVALSIATRRMARRNVVVRHLPAVEGLGACTVIATDKTGTLTVNRLTAKRLWLPEGGVLTVGGEGHDPRGTIASPDGADVAQESLQRLARSAVLANEASYDPAHQGNGISGDTIDIAFLVLAAKAGVGIGELRAGAPRIAELAYSAERKCSASLNRHGQEHHIHVKGAAEVVVPLCAGIDQSAVLARAEEMAAEGYRVLAVAARTAIEAVYDELEAEMHGLTLLGVVGFIDPLRPEAKQAVGDCRRAGVAVRMITGDHPATALAIAREVGIARGPGDVVTGRDLDAARGGDATARAKVAEAAVFARVEPGQKVEIVDALKAQGHFVAMTGDGVNDAPALARADIGVSMGRGGTDVAREASDLILTDDNFASIVSGIEQGRAAYSNVRKVIYLLVSTGAAEAAMFLLALIFGLPPPLGAAQLLWLNLVTNGGQDVALAFEKPEPNLLDRPPRKPAEPLFDGAMIRQTLVSGAYMGIVGTGLFAWALAQGYGDAEARNLLLFLMVLFENVQAFNARSELRSVFRTPLSNNRLLVATVIGAQGLHFAAPFIPGLRDVLDVRPISPGLWAMLFAIALSLLLVIELDKALRRRRAAAGRSA